jgi:hypothetical protein
MERDLCPPFSFFILGAYNGYKNDLFKTKKSSLTVFKKTVFFKDNVKPHLFVLKRSFLYSLQTSTPHDRQKKSTGGIDRFDRFGTRFQWRVKLRDRV